MLRFGRQSETAEFQLVTVGGGTQSKLLKTKSAAKRKAATTKSIPSKHVVKPAWVDEDDVVRNDLIRPPGVLDVNMFIRETKDPSAADLDASDDEYIINCNSKILREEKSEYLPVSKTIDLRRMFDANRERISMGVLTAVHFNPAFHMSLTASADSTLAFFKVDGTENALLRDRVFEKFPLTSAKFTPSGDRVVITGNRNSFRVYDLQTGEETRASRFIGADREELLVKCQVTEGQPNIAALGTNSRQIYLADLRSLEKIAVVRTRGPVRSFCFSENGAFLNTLDASGSSYIFDLRGRKPRAVHQWTDQACTGGTAIACSPDNRWTACGSDCGFVNVYQSAQVMRSNIPEPDKSVSNLTTSIDNLAFHPSSEMLCIGSSQLSAGLRLYHLDGRQVFSNFPVCVGRLGYPTSIAFSPGGGYLCVGQQNGRAALYRILHYAGY
ncbi:U3 small nucleolar RNA-associated protein 18 [Paragonimus skrjabini miyazakii]|uniref:U3 small nucleolar RNA-associated protein 18 n=1 Tax=Paragonimus skrjabini miyazakii TaxID=59628 RepID=A0A8S9Z5R5_9TREM|nr:U3 small nucleolar RNA-associated protein 18 [Paragonimus skrjabini miyazakii]